MEFNLVVSSVVSPHLLTSSHAIDGKVEGMGDGAGVSFELTRIGLRFVDDGATTSTEGVQGVGIGATGEIKDQIVERLLLLLYFLKKLSRICFYKY